MDVIVVAAIPMLSKSAKWIAALLISAPPHPSGAPKINVLVRPHSGHFPLLKWRRSNAVCGLNASKTKIYSSFAAGDITVNL
jgi:hypothetical protein